MRRLTNGARARTVRRRRTFLCFPGECLPRTDIASSIVRLSPSSGCRGIVDLLALLSTVRPNRGCLKSLMAFVAGLRGLRPSIGAPTLFRTRRTGGLASGNQDLFGMCCGRAVRSAGDPIANPTRGDTARTSVATPSDPQRRRRQLRTGNHRISRMKAANMRSPLPVLCSVLTSWIQASSEGRIGYGVGDRCCPPSTKRWEWEKQSRGCFMSFGNVEVNRPFAIRGRARSPRADSTQSPFLLLLTLPDSRNSLERVGRRRLR